MKINKICGFQRRFSQVTTHWRGVFQQVRRLDHTPNLAGTNLLPYCNQSRL